MSNVQSLISEVSSMFEQYASLYGKESIDPIEQAWHRICNAHSRGTEPSHLDIAQTEIMYMYMYEQQYPQADQYHAFIRNNKNDQIFLLMHVNSIAIQKNTWLRFLQEHPDLITNHACGILDRLLWPRKNTKDSDIWFHNDEFHVWYYLHLLQKEKPHSSKVYDIIERLLNLSSDDLNPEHRELLTKTYVLHKDAWQLFYKLPSRYSYNNTGKKLQWAAWIDDPELHRRSALIQTMQFLRSEQKVFHMFSENVEMYYSNARNSPMNTYTGIILGLMKVMEEDLAEPYNKNYMQRTVRQFSKIKNEMARMDNALWNACATLLIDWLQKNKISHALKDETEIPSDIQTWIEKITRKSDQNRKHPWSEHIMIQSIDELIQRYTSHGVTHEPYTLEIQTPLELPAGV